MLGIIARMRDPMCHAVIFFLAGLPAPAQTTPQPVPPTPASAIMDVRPGGADMPPILLEPAPEEASVRPEKAAPRQPTLPEAQSRPAESPAPPSSPARLMLSLPEMDALIKAARQSGGRMTVEVKLEGVTAEDVVVPLAQSGLVTVTRAGDTYVVRPRAANRQTVPADEIRALEAKRRGLLADISALEALAPKEAK